MGHCFSCFGDQANADISGSSHSKKNEMTEVISSNQVPAVVVTEYQQVEPLLQSNENSLSYRLTDANAPFECYVEDMHKTQNDKAQRPFYQKLPSIPKAMSTMGTCDNKVSDTKINQLFDQYKDSLEDAILAEGIESLCNDLQLNPDDFKVLVLAWKLNASQMCCFTKAEFTQGLKNMKTDSIKGIQQKLYEITNELQEESEQFKDLYRFTFKFGLDVSSGQRILPSDIAVVLWRLVFTNNEPEILERWLSYLETNPQIRGIPKDTWYMFLNFCEFVGDDLSNYDDTEAWPSLFDDFVEYENDQLNQNLTKNDIKINY